MSIFSTQETAFGLFLFLSIFNPLQLQHRVSFPTACSDLRAKVTYESYIQRKTDPEGSAKVAYKVV